MSWKPIETPPKEPGYYIITGSKYHIVTSGYWDGAEWYWHNANPKDGKNANAMKVTNVSHWMPLPAAPETSGDS